MQAYIVYRYLTFDFIDTLHSQTKSLFKSIFLFHLITSCWRCATFLKINSKTPQVDQNQGLFPVYLCFLQKSRTFQGLEIYFSNSRSFPVFKDPWEPCSLTRVKPRWSFVCLPCTSSWGAPRVKFHSYNFKDENPSKVFFFHDPLVDMKKNWGQRLYPNFWLLCGIFALLQYCGALIGCPDVSSGFDTNFYEQWSTEPSAQSIWWSYNFFSGPDNNNTCKSLKKNFQTHDVFPHH